MSDKTFLAFIETNAQRCETETLEAARKHIADIIALRLGGKPPGLKRGVAIEAKRLDYEWYEYGEVTRLSPKTCYIQEPGRKHETRIIYSKFAIRILDPKEWSWIEQDLLKRSQEIDEKIAAEERDREEDREAALRDREKYSKKPRIVTIKSGAEVALYRGAYVHAFDADDDHHVYGVVVNLRRSACDVKSVNWSWHHTVGYADCDVLNVLDDAELARVDSVLKSRQKEIEDARSEGKTEKAVRLENEYYGAEVV